MRLIDADKIIDWLWSEPRYYDVCNDRTDTIDYIKNQPTADVQPVVHGKWENYYKCSICGYDYTDIADADAFFRLNNQPEYCGGCGARMDGETNDT